MPYIQWMLRILLVEDEPRIAEAMRRVLVAEHYTVDLATDGLEAIDAADRCAYDVVILDRLLPRLDGVGVIRALRSKGIVTPVLMVTALSALEHRVEGLDAGADDYLGKPFAFHELVARVRALGRRAPSAPPVVRLTDLTVDRARHRAPRGDRTLSLTRKEFGVLEMLAAADGGVVSAEELLEHVWDANADPFSNIVSVTMTRLRRKLGEPPLIRTVVGRGYRLCDHD